MEHPVAEVITVLDLVEWQIRVEAGEKLPFGQDDVTLSRHAIEARVHAEDSGGGFLLTDMGGCWMCSNLRATGVWMDSSLLSGIVIDSDYNLMLSKVIAHGADCDKTLMWKAFLGVQINIEFSGFCSQMTGCVPEIWILPCWTSDSLTLRSCRCAPRCKLHCVVRRCQCTGYLRPTRCRSAMAKFFPQVYSSCDVRCT
ncbi:hypothetical protein [Mycobacterium uberis]|uniref:hypothetical protein n=1 Tax=Mycobacterium uberis TaxID=2162698 RepID=UPI0024371BCB|nr:hypothetical protein [Mycobacterium uberis]